MLIVFSRRRHPEKKIVQQMAMVNTSVNTPLETRAPTFAPPVRTRSISPPRNFHTIAMRMLDDPADYTAYSLQPAAYSLQLFWIEASLPPPPLRIVFF